MKKRTRRGRRWVLGFTLIELAAVAAVVATVPGSAYSKAKERAAQVQCVQNLSQIGKLMIMHVMENETYPEAAFWPDDPVNGADSIMTVLGGDKRLWVCPALPAKLQEKGLTFVYNDELAGKREARDGARVWVLIEISCVSKSAPYPHPAGYNILFADGHVETTKSLPKSIVDNQQARLHRVEDRLEQMLAASR